MKPKTMVLILLAVTCGLGASFMTSRLLSERNQTDEERVDVVVAKKNLDTGLIIKVPEALFEIKQKAKDDVPKDAITKLEDLKGRCLRIPRRAGDMVSQNELLDKMAGFAEHLPEGYRAIGQRVNQESIAGGFASLPLSRVDIVHTVKRGGKDSFSQILLENVLVLAADAQTVRDETGKAMPANVVTFALMPEDALKLDMARQSGAISLLLRKFGESGKSMNLKVSEDSVMKNRSTGGKDEEEQVDPAVAANRNPGGAGGLPDIGSAPRSSAPQFEKKERPFAMVIVNGTDRKRVEFLMNEQGNYEDPSERRAEDPDADEPEVTPPPAANRPQQPRKK